LIAGLTSSIPSHVAAQGVYAVFVLMAIDAVFPAASELVMVVAGALAAGVITSAHHVSVFGAHIGFGAGAFIVLALAGTLGYLAGALIGWWVGLHGGRPLLERRGGWLHVTPANLDRAERWFDRWGNVGVLIGRLTPLVRSFVSIPAGVFEMPIAPYTLMTLVGSAIWAFALAGVGYGLGSSYTRFHHDFKYVEYAVVAGVLVLAAYLVYAAKVRRRAADSPR
jgi:membrane protein DedA with SNARE-associated domain